MKLLTFISLTFCALWIFLIPLLAPLKGTCWPFLGGLSTLSLFKMKWNARKCLDMFNKVARRIFHERRESAISCFFRMIFKAELPLAILPRWVLWLLHNRCYDSGTFNLALKDVFSDDHRIFGAFNRQSTAISGMRFGVMATSIAKDTYSYIFSNFNSDHGSTNNCGLCN